MVTLPTSATFWTFFDHINEGIIVLNVDGAILHVNQVAKQLLNLSPPPPHLQEIYQATQVNDDWHRWEQLLQAPSQMPLYTKAGIVYAQAKSVTWEGQNFIQLVLNHRTPYQPLPSEHEEDKHLYNHLLEHERFLATLGHASSTFNSTSDQDMLFSQICQESIDIFSVDDAYLWREKANSFVGIAATGYGADQFIGSEQETSVMVPMLTRIIAPSGESRYINDFGEPAIDLHLPQPESIKAIMGISLTLKDAVNRVLVLVDRHTPNRFTSWDVIKARAFATQVKMTLNRSRIASLQEALGQRLSRRPQILREERDQFQLLLTITTELSSSLDEDHVLTRALEHVRAIVTAVQGTILLLEKNHDEFMIRASFGGAQDSVLSRGQPSGFQRHEGLAGWVVVNRQPTIVHNTALDERWVMTPNTSDFQSALAVPLASGDEMIGVLMLFHTEPNAFSEEQLDLVNAIGIHVSNAIYNAYLFRLIRNQAERLGNMLRDARINNAKTQAMLQSIADGVLVADESGEVILVNIACGDILGMTRETLMGQNVMNLSGVYGSSGDSWIQTIRDWANNPEQIEGQTYLADELTIADEGKIISVHLAPVFAEGQFFGTVSIFRDRTKEVEVDRMKSEFVATVSHELRTPLTSIKGYTDLMLMGAAGILAETPTRYLNVVKNNADRLQDLVNDLLDISRLEAGKTEINLRPIKIPAIFESVLDHARGRVQHEAKPMDIQVDVGENLPLAYADHSQIVQIVTNLVDNAFNYTLEGGQITMHAQQNGNYIDISVRDTGIGIAPENLEKIFDRFYRSDDARVQQVSGTGLGLAIVRSLVEKNGGQLRVESTVGQGSTFTFNLPFVLPNGSVSASNSGS